MRRMFVTIIIIITLTIMFVKSDNLYTYGRKEKKQPQIAGKQEFYKALEDHDVILLSAFLRLTPKVLSTSYQNNGCSLLLGPITSKDEDSVKLLLEAGVDPNQSCTKTGETPLYYAVKYNQINIVWMLLEYGAKTDCHDEDGENLLHAAIKANSKVCFDLFCNDKLMNEKNKEGCTPYHIAARSGISFFNSIMEITPDIDLQDGKGNTALHYAIGKNKEKNVKTLIGAKCNLNIKNKAGLTPIFLAVEQNIELTKLLVENGADLTVRNNSGLTVFNTAVKYGNTEIIEYLKRKIKNIDN